MMPSIRSILLTLSLLSCISSYVITEPPSSRQADKENLSDLEAFQQLLEQVDPPALHAALHDYSPKKFKHGVFKEDRTAVEAVHSLDAPLATSILSLARRQEPSNNASQTTVATVTVIDSTVTESINPSTVAPNPDQPSSRSTVPATPVPQSPSVPGGPLSPPATSPTVVLVTSTSLVTVSPSVSPSVPLGPGPASIEASSATPGAVLTTTNAAGVTIITTINGGVITLSGPAGAGASMTSAGQVSIAASPSFTSVVLQTTTLPNGSPSTITAVTVIQASGTGVPTPTGSAGAAASTTGPAAGLQSGLAPKSRSWGWEAVGVFGGAVGFAMVL